MIYRFEAVSVEAFVQQLAVCYVRNGYWFYVTGMVPEGKNPDLVDAKLIRQYRIGVSKWTRMRRKRDGIANLQYLRFGRFFVLIAAHGHHRFFDDEPQHRDLRRHPIRFRGYSIGYRKGRDGRGHPSVRIAPDRYRELKAYFTSIAPHRSVGDLASDLSKLPFEPYAPIRRQLLNLLRAINRTRNIAGLEDVPVTALRLKRRPIVVFRADDGFCTEGLEEDLPLADSSLPLAA